MSRRGVVFFAYAACAACGTTLDLGDRPSANDLDGGVAGPLRDAALEAAQDVVPSAGRDGGRNDAGAVDATVSLDAGSDAPLQAVTCGTGTASPTCLAFVTSATYAADFGGLAAADAKCNLAATTAQLPGAGNYKAYLSDGTAPTWSRVASAGPWMLVGGGGSVILDGPAALRVNGGTTLDRDESGNQILGAQYWTGAGAQGYPGDTCAGFTSMDSKLSGAIGTWPHWIDSFSANCAGLPQHLLCLQD